MLRSRDQYPSSSRPATAPHRSAAPPGKASQQAPPPTMAAQTRHMLTQEWLHQGNAALANLDHQQAITAEHAEKQERMNGQAAMYVDQFKAATRAEDMFCAQDAKDAEAAIERIMQQVRQAEQHCKTANTKKKNSVQRQQQNEKQTVEVGEATVLLQANFEDRLPDLKASSELTEKIAQEKDDALALADKYKDSAYGLTDEAAAWCWKMSGY